MHVALFCSVMLIFVRKSASGELRGWSVLYFIIYYLLFFGAFFVSIAVIYYWVQSEDGEAMEKLVAEAFWSLQRYFAGKYN